MLLARYKGDLSKGPFLHRLNHRKNNYVVIVCSGLQVEEELNGRSFS